MIIMPDYREACVNYANGVTGTKIDLYGKGGQNSPSKIWQDNYHGKLAEFAAYHWLISRGLEESLLTNPLIKVLKIPNWDADLYYEGYKYAISVKTCYGYSFTRFGYGWTFQLKRGNKKGDPIFYISNPNYKVIFVRNKSDTQFEIYGTSDAQKLKEKGAYRFHEGIDLPKFRDEKRFVLAGETDAINEEREEVMIVETLC